MIKWDLAIRGSGSLPLFHPSVYFTPPWPFLILRPMDCDEFGLYES